MSLFRHSNFSIPDRLIIGAGTAVAIAGLVFLGDQSQSPAQAKMAEIRAMRACGQSFGVPDPDNPGFILVNLTLPLTKDIEFSRLTQQEVRDAGSTYLFPDVSQVYDNGQPQGAPTNGSLVRLDMRPDADGSVDQRAAIATISLANLGSISCAYVFNVPLRAGN